MHNPVNFLENEILWDLRTDHPILARRRNLVLINNKKRICHLHYTLAVNLKVNVKEGEKQNKYLDLAKELKKLWNMKITNCSWCP